MGYFRDMFGSYRSKEFIEGVIAGMEAFAVWRNGTQWIGSPEQRLKDAIEEVKEDLGYYEKKEVHPKA